MNGNIMNGNIIVTSSNLLSIAVNGAHVKMADLRRWATITLGSEFDTLNFVYIQISGDEFQLCF